MLILSIVIKPHLLPCRSFSNNNDNNHDGDIIHVSESAPHKNVHMIEYSQEVRRSWKP